MEGGQPLSMNLGFQRRSLIWRHTRHLFEHGMPKLRQRLFTNERREFVPLDEIGSSVKSGNRSQERNVDIDRILQFYEFACGKLFKISLNRT